MNLTSRRYLRLMGKAHAKPINPIIFECHSWMHNNHDDGACRHIFDPRTGHGYSTLCTLETNSLVEARDKTNPQK